MKRVTVFITSLIVFLDILFIVIADLASFIVRFDGRFPPVNFDAYRQLFFVIIILRLSSFYVFHLYEKPTCKSDFETLINILKAATSSSIIIMSITYFMDIKAYPRLIVALSWIFTTAAVFAWRVVVRDFVRLYLGEDIFKARLLIVGTGAHAREVASRATMDSTIDYKFLGFVDPETRTSRETSGSDILGTLDDIQTIIKKYSVDEVIIADPDLGAHKVARLMQILTPRKIALKSIPVTYETVVSHMILCEEGIPFVGPTISAKPATWYWGLKRILDVISSLALLVITLPAAVLAIILVKITSRGPAFFLQKRVGMNGKRFVIYKLRTMYSNSRKTKIPRWTRQEDARITPVGKILRRFRIDELPQLVNILQNQMSLMGPRPETPYYVTKLVEKIPFYAERLQAKPGITGWAQVNFGYSATEGQSEKKLLYDLFYVRNMSLGLDLLIAFKTLKVIITGQGAQ